MTVYEAYIKAVSVLKEKGFENCEFEARTMLQHTLSYTYSDFLLNKSTALSEENCNKFLLMLNERLGRRPLQYIIGEWDFMDLTFEVGEGVLIPRPETEEICRYVTNKLKDKDECVVFDLCSGSGCIGLSIKHYLPKADVYLIEYSEDALLYLNKNRVKLGFARTVPVIKGDVLKGFEQFAFLPKPDVIISNPPYIKSDDVVSLQTEVLHEPMMALDGGSDGYVFYECFAEQWLDFINPGGFFAVECGEDQAKYIAEMFSKKSKKTEIIRDFNNIERFVVAYK